MTTALVTEREQSLHEETLRPLPQACRLCGAPQPAAPVAICEECLGPLEPVYDPDRPLPDAATIASRPGSLWRYREWLPFEGEPVLSLDSGFTPLVEAPALARRLGVGRLWIKNDSVCHPSLSFKDRVVASAINAARAFGLDTVGCASTGNLANAVAAQAARAGLAAWIFIPHDLEIGKVVGTAVYNPHLVRIRGTYDDVNRLCTQAADRFGWGLVNINLRGYYGEGSKTVAFEICEQLGWRTPTAVVAPMAGGSLVTKLGKGFAEFAKAGLVSGPAPRLLRRAGRRLRADRAPGRVGRRAHRAGHPEHHRPLHRDRESGRRPLRRAGDPGHRRLGRRRHGRGSGGRDPAPRRDDRHLHRDGGRRHRGRRRSRSPARAGSAPRTRSSSASPATDSRPWRRFRACCPRPPSSHRKSENWRRSMAVTFSLPTVLAKLADGQSTIQASGTTLGDVVAQIADRFPRLAPRLRDTTGGPYPFVTFYLNDEDIRFRNGFATPVTEGDEITVVAAIAGG